MKLFQELRVLEFFQIRVGLLADFPIHFDAVELDEAWCPVVVAENFSRNTVINEGPIGANPSTNGACCCSLNG